MPIPTDDDISAFSFLTTHTALHIASEPLNDRQLARVNDLLRDAVQCFAQGNPAEAFAQVRRARLHYDRAIGECYNELADREAPVRWSAPDRNHPGE